MYAQERHREICLILNNLKSISVDEISARFNVSKATIRRDINILEKQGHLIRTHGGAIRNDRFVTPEKYNIREDINKEIKCKIAKTAVTMIKSFDTIMVDGGTTTFQVMVELRKRQDLEGITLITNSIPVILELAKNPKIKTVLLGGHLAANELSLLGPLSLKDIENFKASKTIVGVSGVDLKYGFTEGDEYVAELKKKMLELSEQNIVVTDSSKFQNITSFRLAPLSDFDIIITDSGINSQTRKALIQNGVNLITV